MSVRIPETHIDWLGDGRKMQHPPKDAIGSGPTPVRLGTAKVLAEHFVQHGTSRHSAMGSTVWVILDYCAAQSIPYDLTVHVGPYGTIDGYTVTRTPKFY